MAHIRLRKDKNGRVRYQILVEVWQSGRKYYKSKTCNSKREALAWEGKIKHEIRSGILTPESLKNRKLSEAIEQFIARVLPQKPKNSRNVEQHLGWWKDQIGHVGLSDITPSMLVECRDRLLKEPTVLGKPRAPATVVRYLSSLSSVFETAIREWHWVEKNPIRLIRKPTVSNARTRFLSEDECHRLLAACKTSKNPYLYPVVAIALGSGMRKGEILNLCWQDIDFNKKLMFLGKTKNGSIRYVPMVGLVHNVLLELYQGAEHPHMITFLNKLRQIGGGFDVRENGIEFFYKGPLKGGIHIETDVHPGFLTDWQQPFVTLLTQAEGTSIIHETIYENRFGYAKTLVDMGADIELYTHCLGEKKCRFASAGYSHSLIVKGPTPLLGKEIAIPDLRAGFAYVMAALIAPDESLLTGLHFLDRGYEKFSEKLSGLGANIEPYGKTTTACVTA
ncbi:MAG: UDP-N-acetylglucosamine 1-carboxyvinyltransferase 1 [Chlamydiae bacterium]|nr:UDP-N-acetylglucosamine 1-carboxyvinyltransferase 1 [Chlamydiota bacterium]